MTRPPTSRRAWPAGAAAALAEAGAAAALAAAGAHALPGLAWVAPLRCRVAPRLAGLGRRGHVALTFDDGPDPQSTPIVLEALAAKRWRATFFLLGSMTAANPGLAAEIVAAGHEVAVHGYDHRGALRRTPRALLDDLGRARDTIEAATGAHAFWYRPPFGELSGGALYAARRCNLHTVLWSAWARDWRAEATPGSLLTDLRRGVIDGGTILLHDSDCTSAAGSWRTMVGAFDGLAGLFTELGVMPGPLLEHGIGIRAVST